MKTFILPSSLPQSQYGLSLIELAITLVALGLMTWAVANAYGNAARQRDRDSALAQGEQMRDVIRSFALNNARLPCPDTNGNGWEGNADGVCTEAEVGWLPYRSLGFDLPDARFRAVYGVYRIPPIVAIQDADPVTLKERSTPEDSPGDAGYKNVHDLITALNFAATVAEPPSTNHIRLTGDGAMQGAIDCKNNIHHPAFALVIPLEDMDGDTSSASGANGSRFDGLHTGLPGTGNCLHAPGTPATAQQDDVVIAESFSALTGWLAARAP